MVSSAECCSEPFPASQTICAPCFAKSDERDRLMEIGSRVDAALHLHQGDFGCLKRCHWSHMGRIRHQVQSPAHNRRGLS